MLSSAHQVEHRMDKAYPCTFTPIYQYIDEENQLKDDTEQHHQYAEFCTGIVQTSVSLVAFLMFCIMIAVNHNLHPVSDPTPPKIFLHSLRVPSFNISDGELSATWDINLNISNYGVNSTLVNFLDFQAFVLYKDKEALAVNSPIKFQNGGIPGIFMVDQNENKTLQLKFATTGWERDQPIVDDSVIQEIAQDRKRGIVGFGLKIIVDAELKINNMLTLPIIMSPYCSDLKVQLAPLERGEAAILVNAQPRECIGPVEWEYI